MVATKNTPDSQFEFDISNLFGIWDLGFLATEMSGLDETPWDVCDFNFLCSSALALIQWQCGKADPRMGLVTWCVTFAVGGL